MKTKNEVYSGIVNDFYKHTNIDIEQGSVLDSYVLASAGMIEDAHQEIEDNKTPHIYTSLSGGRIDDAAVLVGLTRRAEESDKSFLYRFMNWNISNKSSNSTAIETALMDMTYCSNAKHIPMAFGCGTAAIYIIPKTMDEQGIKLAIAETKERLKGVTSPSSHIEYIIPDLRPIKLTLLIKSTASDLETLKANISEKIVTYVNGIAPGEYLEVGKINNIGRDDNNVTFFNTGHLFVDGKETGEVSILQKVKSKFLMSAEDIIWLEVE